MEPWDNDPRAPFNQGDKSDEEIEDELAQEADWEARVTRDDEIIKSPR